MKTALILLFQVITAFAFAQQIPARYVPRSYYVTEELVPVFEKRKDAAVKNAPNTSVSNYFILLARQMNKNVYHHGFLADYETEVQLDRVLKKLLEANPQLKRPAQQVLIMRDSYVNARSFGEGTVGITTAMLSRLDSEAILAYILAHEISHYELDHVSKIVQKNSAEKTSRKVKKGFEKIAVADKKVTTSDIDSLKKWIYDESHFYRDKEAEADSLGFILAKNAGYESGGALTMITLLDSANVPKYHIGNLIHDSFNSKKVPFQDYWLSPRLSLFDQDRNLSFFSDDSLQSHPDLPSRRQKLIAMGASNELPLTKKSMFWNSDLENIESAILQNRYDEALLLSLTALPQMPDYASYLKGVIAGILIDVYEVKDSPLMNSYVPSYVHGYSNDLKTVNAFLHNIHKDALGELAFDFINRKGNFNLEAESHYYQLWRIADLTDRDELKTRVKKAYRDRFGKGEYYGKMENTIKFTPPALIKPTNSY